MSGNRRPDDPLLSTDPAAERDALLARMRELEETLEAIHTGEADALVVQTAGGPSVFTLEGAEHPYRVMVEAMSEGAFTFAPDGTVLYCNRRFAELLGRPLETVIGAALAELIGRDAVRAIERSSGSSVELTLLRPDGGLTPVQISPRRLEDHGRDLTCAVVTDLSAIHAGLEVRLRLAGIVESSSDAIVAQSLDGVVLTWNRAAEEIYGWPEAEIVGRPVSALVPDDRARENEEQIRRALEGQTAAADTVRVRRDGSQIDVHVTFSPVRDAASRVIAISTISRDISARKAADRELARYNRRVRILHEVDRAILAARSVEEIANTAVGQMRELLGYDRVALVLFDYQAQQAVVVAVASDGVDPLGPGSRLPIDDFRVSEELRAGDSQVIEDLGELRSPTVRERLLIATGARLDASVPLITGQRLIGVLTLGRRAPGRLEPYDAEIARQLADSLAVVLENARLFAEVSASRERLQALSRRLVHIQEDERRLIAAELHDETGQSLTTLLIGLTLLERELNGHPAAGRTAELRATISSIMEGLHRLAMDLRPAALDRMGLVSAVRNYIDLASVGRGTRVDFEAVGFADERLAVEIESTVFRVVQEAITNVRRHAQAQHVSVLLERRPASVVVIIEDDGVGFDAATACSNGRIGLLGMRDRVDMIGGSLRIESEPGHGTTIIAELDLGPSC